MVFQMLLTRAREAAGVDPGLQFEAEQLHREQDEQKGSTGKVN